MELSERPDWNAKRQRVNLQNPRRARVKRKAEGRGQAGAPAKPANNLRCSGHYWSHRAIGRSAQSEAAPATSALPDCARAETR